MEIGLIDIIMNKITKISLIISVVILASIMFTASLFAQINYIEGLPYELYNFTYTTATFDDVDGANFQAINSIKFYSKGFDNDSEIIGEISVKDLSIIGAQKIETVEKSGVIVQVLAPEGYYFNSDWDIAQNQTLKLIAQVRNDGKLVAVDSSEVKVYWFRENPLVNSRHDLYNRFGGEGWMCLNQREPLYDDNGNEVKNENGETVYSKTWIPASMEYLVTGKDILSKSGNFKCVVQLGGKQDSSELITLYHTTDDLPSFSIQSKENGNKISLTCVPYSEEYTYEWTRMKSNKTILQLQTGNVLSDEINTLLIDGNEEYSCVVLKDGILVANPKITIFAGEKVDPDYKVIIQNGERMFLYNEDGSAKAYDIPALEVAFYNPQGQLIAQDQYTVTWKIPTESLIKTDFVIDDQIESNSNALKYNIAARYKQSLKNADQIKAIVTYKDVRAEGVTNIMFAREGELGTNGTGTYCVIKPNTNDIVNAYPTYTWLNDVQKGWNFDTNPADPFKVFLWSGMDQSEEVSPTWSVLSAKLLNTTSSFAPNNWTPLRYPEAGMVNIFKAEVGKNSQTYSSAIVPICAKVYHEGDSIELKYGTGFQDILFSSDGRNAKFIDRPFEVVVKTSLTQELNYKWYIRDKNNLGILTSRTEDNKNIFAIDVKPAVQYNGKDSSLALECVVTTTTEVEVARIYIPIHMHLNTYGINAINGWDGNSLVLNEEKSAYLLAPQVGAGKKDNENKFTGIVMGEVQEGIDTSKVGLFGYNSGIQTIFLDANSGAATFGSALDNQIILDPQSKKLTIHGDIYANDGNFSGKIEATSGSFKNGTFGDLEIIGKLKYKGENNPYYIGTGSTISSDYINIPNFKVGKDSAKISGFNFNETALYTGEKSSINSNISNGIYLGTEGFALGGMVGTDYELQEGNYQLTSLVNEFKISKEDFKWNMIMANGSIRLFCPAIIPEDGPGSKNKFISLDGQNGDIIISNNYDTKFAQGQQMILNIDGIKYFTEDKDAFIKFLPEEEKESSTYLIRMSDSYISQIYSASSTIITSDETKKNTITPLSNQYSLLFDNLQPVTFKYNDGTSDRLHIGFGARATEQAALDAGLTTKDFAAVCYGIDEEGNKVDYGIRYEEIVALNTSEIQKLKARINELEDIIYELKIGRI